MTNSSTGVEVLVEDSTIVVRGPWHPAFLCPADALGGKWENHGRQWRFAVRNEAAVRALCRDVYGTDDSESAVTVTVRVDLHDLPDGDVIWAVGRRIARRWTRNTCVELGEGVAVVAGRFASEGGSLEHPRVDARPGTIVEICDVPVGHRDLGMDAVTIAAPLAELEDTHARLVAEVAAVEAAIARLL